MTRIRESASRCAWAEGDPLMTRYHDEEWGVPERGSRALWEALMLDGFQAGLSWRTILHKREAFRRAFKEFDPKAVARFTPRDIERLMRDEGIVRARAKIVATIGGARAYLEMESEGPNLSTFAWEFVGGKPIVGTGKPVAKTEVSERLSKELKARGFKFVGPTIVYAWMQAVGLVNDHHPDCFRRTEVGRSRGSERRPTTPDK
jgi:DNA-3-methyladenine glycosylase I